MQVIDTRLCFCTAEEVDRMFDRQMTEIVELTESTESAYEVFREVVTMLLAGEGRGAGVCM